MYFERSTNRTFYSNCSSRFIPNNTCNFLLKLKSCLGTLLGRHLCQRLDVNQKYIVFLEPFFDGTYRPVDFQEILYNDQADVILGKTCGLSRTYPFTESNDTASMLTNKCPATISTNCLSGLLNKYLSRLIFVSRNIENYCSNIHNNEFCNAWEKYN